jgi:hypothetical protein
VPDLAPAIVRNMTRALWRATRVVPAADLLQDGRWRVVLPAGRVVMTGYYTPTGRGAYAWGDSRLDIDGAKVPDCRGVHHLAEIIKDPDAYLALPPVEREGERLTVYPSATPPGAAPAAVRTFMSTLERATPDFTTTLNVDGSGQWVVTSAGDDGRRMHVVFRGRGVAYIQIENADEVKRFDSEGLEAALAALFPAAPSLAAPSPVAGQTRSGARANSVEVRRATVVRT